MRPCARHTSSSGSTSSMTATGRRTRSSPSSRTSRLQPSRPKSRTKSKNRRNPPRKIFSAFPLNPFSLKRFSPTIRAAPANGSRVNKTSSRGNYKCAMSPRVLLRSRSSPVSASPPAAKRLPTTPRRLLTRWRPRRTPPPTQR